MSKRRVVLKAFTWAVSITSLFVILLSAGLVSLIVGDWLMMKTGNEILSWGVGFFNFLGFLCSLGACIGIWMWLRGPISFDPDDTDTMSIVLSDIADAERD